MKKNRLAIKTTVLVSALTFSYASLAFNIEQSAEYGILGNSIKHSLNSEKESFEVRHAQHRFLGENRGDNIASIRYRYGVAGNQYHAAFSHSENERHVVLGYSLGRLTISAMTGDAESFVRNAENFQGLNRFGFHGGNNIGFQFHGAGIDTRLTKNIHSQFGFARLDSYQSDIEQRGVKYFELSSTNSPWQSVSGLYSRFSVFDRGQTQVGQAIEAGFNYKQATFMLQGMKVNGNKRLMRIRTQFAINDATHVAFDLSQTRDPFHFDETRYTSLFSIQHLVGVKPKKYFGIKEDDAASKKKKASSNRPLLIGAGIVAGAALVSSGSDSTDESVRSANEVDAAFAVLSGINPTSVRENREYGGWIFRNQDKTFGSTNPVKGEAASVMLPNPFTTIPGGSTLTASYHTHAGFDPRYDNENFSPQDIRSDNALGIGGYLATPGGTFQYHFGGNIQLLGRIAN